MVKKVTFFVVLFLLGLIPTSFAQISSVVSEVKIGNAKENETLTIEARFQPSSSVTKAVIGYRSFGQNEFIYSDMIVQGSSAFFTIPAAEVLPPNIEYFMKFSMTLLRASDIVSKGATKIYLDNNDITNMALFADDIIIISPENFQIQLKDGLHNLSVELYDTTNTLYHSVSSQFVMLNPSYALLGQSAINYTGDVRFESRNENIQTVG